MDHGEVNNGEEMITITHIDHDHDHDDHQQPAIPNYRGAKALPYIIGNEAFQKLSSTGIAANFQVYLIQVFNMKSIYATIITNTYIATSDLATLPGAFLSDTYFGRYSVISFCSFAGLLGMFMLTLTAFPKFHPPHCDVLKSTNNCHQPSSKQLGFLFTSLVLLIISTGGIRPCNLPFGVDQFNPKTESGKKGINSFFNWYYFTSTFSILLSLTVTAYIQTNVSWILGFAIMTFLMFMSCIVFFVGKKIYVLIVPQGSPLTSIIQVIVCTIKKRRVKLPKDGPWLKFHDHFPVTTVGSKLPSTPQFRFLDKAAIICPEDDILPNGSASNPWRLSSIQQIEEVKCLIRIVPVWISCIFFPLSMNNLNTYTTYQALQSDRHLTAKFSIPAASYGVFAMLTVNIWIPIYDRIIIPRLRKFTKEEQGITLLQRIGVGFFITAITMIVSGLVEKHRRDFTIGVGKEKGNVSSLSGNWLILQMSMIGLAEVYVIIGMVEFHYKQFPENMKSISGAFLSLAFAISNYLNNFLITAVHRYSKRWAGGKNWLADDLNKGRLDYFYYLLAFIQILNCGYFLVCAKWYKYRRTEPEEEDEHKKDQDEEDSNHQ